MKHLCIYFFFQSTKLSFVEESETKTMELLVVYKTPSNTWNGRCRAVYREIQLSPEACVVADASKQSCIVILARVILGCRSGEALYEEEYNEIKPNICMPSNLIICYNVSFYGKSDIAILVLNQFIVT